MLKNYLKTAFRTMARNRVYSFITILGLTIGLWACMMVATIVIDDLSYDKQWSRSDDLYRIVSVNKMGEDLYDRFASSFAGVAPALKNNYPEVEAVAVLSTYKQRLKLHDAEPNGVEVIALNTDTAVWKMLDLDVLEGDPKKFAEGNTNLVITEGFRKKHFAGEDPVGKIIHDVPAYSDKSRPYLITGVIKDLPANTHLRAEAILVQKRRTEEVSKKQYGSFTQNYILMKPGTDMVQFAGKVNKWYAGFVEVENPYQFEFQNVKDIYLQSDFAKSQLVKGSYSNIFIFSGVALLLLVIACVNFINLSTARAIQRVKETGVRKILGAGRTQLVWQFLTESTLFFFIATFLSTVIYRLTIHSVENFIGHQLAQTFVTQFYLLAIIYAFIFIISLLIGFYPAWILSGFKPAASLKGKFFAGSFSGQNLVRKSLVVLQFSISIIVLVALIIVQKQVRFMNNKDLGYNKSDLLYTGNISWDGKGEAFKNELLNNPSVISASISTWSPSVGAGFMSKEIDDPNHAGNRLNVWYINADIDLAKTLGLRLQKGRLLDQRFAADMASQDSMMQMSKDKYQEAAGRQSSLISAYTAKLLHVNNLDETIKNALTTPVGIVADFNNESLRKPLQPTIILAEKAPEYGGMLIRIKPGAENEIITFLDKLWREFYPNKLLDIQWVDDMLAAQYKAESKLQQLFGFFSGVSMFLAALGIFGLIVQATTQRVKEIGIRKVLGASVHSIVRLFSLDFLKLVLLAIMIASPVAWWLMQRWLQDFAYRIDVDIWVFALAGSVAVLVAMLTISSQSVRAASANPVKSLRTE